MMRAGEALAPRLDEVLPKDSAIAAGHFENAKTTEFSKGELESACQTIEQHYSAQTTLETIHNLYELKVSLIKHAGIPESSLGVKKLDQLLVALNQDPQGVLLTGVPIDRGEMELRRTRFSLALEAARKQILVELDQIKDRHITEAHKAQDLYKGRSETNPEQRLLEGILTTSRENYMESMANISKAKEVFTWKPLEAPSQDLEGGKRFSAAIHVFAATAHKYAQEESKRIPDFIRQERREDFFRAIRDLERLARIDSTSPNEERFRAVDVTCRFLRDTLTRAYKDHNNAILNYQTKQLKNPQIRDALLRQYIIK
ncbi:MAG TPA: hypothetical protein VEA59_01735 [Patescibacteria group bacterium]|nr:hypothetical protein [Patescibacteria group bacterium]